MTKNSSDHVRDRKEEQDPFWEKKDWVSVCDGLKLFNEGFYWECHEVLEDV